MHLGDQRIDAPILRIVKDAVANIVEARQQDGEGVLRWSDSEREHGFQKDCEGLLIVARAYLDSAGQLPDPALPVEEMMTEGVRLLGGFAVAPGTSFRGFTSEPYAQAYFEPPIDYVDSAATVGELAIALTELSVRHPTQSAPTQRETFRAAVEASVRFLLDSRLDSPSVGTRWQAIASTNARESDGDLFFTRYASMFLHRLVSENMPEITGLISSERRRQVELALAGAAKWTMQLYDRDLQEFWVDGRKSTRSPLANMYALEVIYELIDPIPEEWRDRLRSVVERTCQRISSAVDAQALQEDLNYRYTIQQNDTQQTVYHDDRGYIGWFLFVLTLARTRDPEVATEAFERAAEVFSSALQTEWIDDSAGFWDDGRPLLCYARQALGALVAYSRVGTRPPLTLKDQELRTALRSALQNPDVVDTLVSAFAHAVERNRNQALTTALHRQLPRNARQ